MVRNNKKTKSEFILSNSEDNDNYSIPLDQAYEIAVNILKEYSFQQDEIDELSDDFNDLLQNDLFFENIKDKRNFNNINKKSNNINFDSLALFLINNVVRKKREILNELNSKCLIYCKSRFDSRINYQDFVKSVKFLFL